VRLLTICLLLYPPPPSDFLENVNPPNTLFGSEDCDRDNTAGVHVKTMIGGENRSTGEYAVGGECNNYRGCVEGGGGGRSVGLLSVNSVYDLTNSRTGLKFVGNGTYYFFTTFAIEMVIWRVIKSSVTSFDIQNISWRKKCE
jgi:hypothetical protein